MFLPWSGLAVLPCVDMVVGQLELDAPVDVLTPSVEFRQCVNPIGVMNAPLDQLLNPVVS